MRSTVQMQQLCNTDQGRCRKQMYLACSKGIQEVWVAAIIDIIQSGLCGRIEQPKASQCITSRPATFLLSLALIMPEGYGLQEVSICAGSIYTAGALYISDSHAWYAHLPVLPLRLRTLLTFSLVEFMAISGLVRTAVRRPWLPPTAAPADQMWGFRGQKDTVKAYQEVPTQASLMIE